MSRDYQLTNDQKSIQGMFWFEGCEEEPFQGVLYMEAGKSPKLETAHFNYEGWGNMFPGASKKKKGESQRLQGHAVTAAMRASSKQVIFGHDDHGKKITLVNAHTSSSQSTLALESFTYLCQTAIFGAHLDIELNKFKGIRLRVDHLDEWVGRCAFQQHSETYEAADGKQKLSKVTIPIAQKLAIPLNFPSYRKSEFFCAWNMSYGTQRFELHGRVYLDLHFDSPMSWLQVLEQVHRWEWFFSLAARDTLDLSHLELTPNSEGDDSTNEFTEGYAVWLKRRNSAQALHPKRTSHDFHFTYSDIQKSFSEIIAKWQAIQGSWAAVLHRFFAISAPRDIWLNEEFLFLAQAIESLHRARTGSPEDNVDLKQAAKHAWEDSPSELQQLLGKKKDFINQLRKSRNYWTHYREPGPEADPDVLDGRDLIYFNEKLRWIIESSILSEIGLPSHCISRVWSPQWKVKLVDYD